MTRYDSNMAQRMIVFQVLRDDHPEPWTHTELQQQSPDLDPRTVRDGLAGLAAEGVVILDADTVTASPCARHLDALDLIGV